MIWPLVYHYTNLNTKNLLSLQVFFKDISNISLHAAALPFKIVANNCAEPLSSIMLRLHL